MGDGGAAGPILAPDHAGLPLETTTLMAWCFDQGAIPFTDLKLFHGDDGTSFAGSFEFFDKLISCHRYASLMHCLMYCYFNKIFLLLSIFMDNQLLCPKCQTVLPVDSVREYSDGRKRIYWECKSCDLSIMDRGGVRSDKD